jgi:sugar (pentulose or hexulose) kinase
VIAGAGAGVIKDYRTSILRAMKRRKTYEPNAANHTIYQERTREYGYMLEALSECYHKF